MSMLQESIEAILEKTRHIARSETLIGEPIKFNDLLVVPVVKVSIGFGVGAGEGTEDKEGRKIGGTGGGAAGGIKVEPSCFLVHDGTTVRILHASASKAKGMDALIEKLPDLMTYAMDSLRGAGDKDEEAADDEKSE